MEPIKAFFSFFIRRDHKSLWALLSRDDLSVACSLLLKEYEMKKRFLFTFGSSLLTVLFVLLMPYQTAACSTFKLQKGKCLIYGHNLNQEDIDVPGLIFINKHYC